MDNLTHSLIGAVLGQAGLKRRTALAMPALIIAANLPDIDVAGRLFGWQSLVVHRGFTHGLGGVVLLPALLCAGLLLYARWRGGADRAVDRPVVRPGWLLGLCYLAYATHPAFDWLNTYGIRLMEPFSHRWYYGDALFIIDVWLLALMGAGVWLSARREQAGRGDWPAPARLAILGVVAYVGLNLAITARAQGEAESALGLARGGPPGVICASPVPLAFWRREVQWRGVGERYGAFGWSLFGPAPRATDPALRPMGRTGMDDPRIALWSRDNPRARAWLFWARLPLALPDAGGLDLVDQRYMGMGGRAGLGVRLGPR